MLGATLRRPLICAGCDAITATPVKWLIAIEWLAWKHPRFQHIGLVGYVYHQLSGDSGSGATLGDFESRVYAVGPQAGYFFPVGKAQGYLNLRGYYEFDASKRVEGWNAWLTLSYPFGSGDN